MTVSPDRKISEMFGEQALPRKNGELVFDEPWEGRAFGLAVAMSHSGAFEWADFRDELIEAISSDERHGVATGYYQRWARALERLALKHSLITSAELDAKIDSQKVDDHGVH